MFQIAKVFNIYDVFGCKQCFVPCQILICNEIKPDYIKTDALIASVQNVLQHSLINAGIVAEISLCPPTLVPSKVK